MRTDKRPKYGPEEHPNDSPRDGTIHEIARQQLVEWQRIAEDWPLADEMRYDEYLDRYRAVVACARCTQNLWFQRDDYDMVYEYKPEEWLSLIVAHIRQRHSEAIDGNV